MALSLVISLFLFVSISGSDAMNCINSIQPVRISNDFTVSAVEKVLKDLTLTDTYNECFVRISINYLYHNIEINFGITSETVFLMTNKEVYVQFSIDFAEDKTMFDSSEMIHVLEFACDNADACDRDIVLRNLEWLLKGNYGLLESAIRPLHTTSDEHFTGLCIDHENKTEQRCSVGLCFVFYTSTSDTLIGHCNDKESLTRLYLRSGILADNDIYQTDKDNQLEINKAETYFGTYYWCQTNYCNNGTVVDLIRKAIKDHYNLSPMYQALNVEIEQEVEENDTTESLVTSTTTTTTVISTTSTTYTVKQDNNIATSLHISLMMIIFNIVLSSGGGA